MQCSAMKTDVFQSVLSGALILAAAAVAPAASITSLPPAATMNIVATNSGSMTRLTLSNAGNQVWVVQCSSNLTDWTEVEAWKVNNGLFRRIVAPAILTPHLFYRAVYDETRQNIFSTTNNALLWPASAFNYAAPALPANFSLQPILGQDNMPVDNVTTDAGATLGRVLFYDKRLSTNQTLSCSSCHQRENGFSDPRKFSVGFGGGLTGRNSMGLSNARWYQRRHFFWDERANTLEDQVLMPIQNSVEMGMTVEALTNRLAAEPFYTNLFATTFGTPVITTNRIARARAPSSCARSCRCVRNMTSASRTGLPTLARRKILAARSSLAR